MAVYHTERICESCIDTATRLHELDRIRSNVRSRKHRVARNWKLSREDRWATLDMLDNTLSDLNVTARSLRREHAEHMNGRNDHVELTPCRAALS